MAVGSKVKGITIEFNGDTTKLGRALSDIDKKTKTVDQSLKDVNDALKFNPKNTELLAQKQQLLGQKVDQTKERLKLLQNTQKNLDKDPSVDKTSQQYTELRREIIETESKLKHFEAQVKELDHIKLTQLGESFKSVGDKMKNIGQNMTTAITLPIAGAFTASAKLASDYEENMNKIDVAFGSSSEEVKKWADNARDQFGLSKVAASDAVSAFGALGKGIGLSEGDAAKMSTTLAGLSADLASYFNTGTDESAKALEGIFTGESESLKKFGVVMTDTNLEKFASDQGLVWKEMDQSQKVALRYQYVLAKTKDAQGDYARTSDGTANSLKTFKAAAEDLGTAIGTQLLPMITPIIQKITEWIQKFSDLDPKTQKIITVIGIIAGALGPVLMIIGTIATGIGSIITLITTVGPMIAGLAGPIGIAIAIIGGLIAVGVILYKNWDKIKAKASELKDNVVKKFTALKIAVKVIFGHIKDAMLAPIKKAAETIKGLIQKIKNFFKFKVSLPKIKLPHFSIQPKGWQLGDLLQGSIPSLGIDWHADGIIFKKPTVIGKHGFGEAGAEAAMPLDTLWDQMDGMFARMADSIVNGVSLALAAQNAGMRGDIVLPIYLYPSGPKMGEETVKMYDLYSGRLKGKTR